MWKNGSQGEALDGWIMWLGEGWGVIGAGGCGTNGVAFLLGPVSTAARCTRKSQHLTVLISGWRRHFSEVNMLSFLLKWIGTPSFAY